MFNATELRAKAQKDARGSRQLRFDSYYKRTGFMAILHGLLHDGVPEPEIIRTTRGPHGETWLHDAFFIDMAAWLGGSFYYKCIRKFVVLPVWSKKK